MICLAILTCMRLRGGGTGRVPTLSVRLLAGRRCNRGICGKEVWHSCCRCGGRSRDSPCARPVDRRKRAAGCLYCGRHAGGPLRGAGPRFAATAASLLIGWWFFIAPNRGLTLGQPAGAVNLVLFALVGVGITLLNSHLRRLHLSTMRSEERFRLLSETLPHFVWTCTADGLCDYLNARWAAYTGLPATEQLG